jgi:hypothetical protein
VGGLPRTRRRSVHDSGTCRVRRMPDEAVHRGLPRPLPDTTAGIATWLYARDPGCRGDLVTRKRSGPGMLSMLKFGFITRPAHASTLHEPNNEQTVPSRIPLRPVPLRRDHDLGRPARPPATEDAKGRRRWTRSANLIPGRDRAASRGEISRRPGPDQRIAGVLTGKREVDWERPTSPVRAAGTDRPTAGLWHFPLPRRTLRPCERAAG